MRRSLLSVALLALMHCASVRHSNAYIVQVATYWQPQDAYRLSASLTDRGFDAFVLEQMGPRSSRLQSIIVAADRGETYPTVMEYKVRIGPYNNAADAERTRGILRAEGFTPYVVGH